MYLRHGEEGKEDRVEAAEDRGEEKNEVDEEPEVRREGEERRREGEERRREGGIRGNRMERGNVPVVLFFEECEVGFGAKEQRMQEHSLFLRVP